MDINALKEKIEKNVAGVKLKVVRESLLIEDPNHLVAVAVFLKDDQEIQLDYLSSVTGSDFINFLECVYHFYSIKLKGPLVTLRVRTADRENPVFPSLVTVYRGAEFQEREAYDMFGIRFENHPDLRRIFMWEGFEGFPLRKDYQQEDSETLEMEDIEWLEKHQIQVDNAVKDKAAALKKEGKRAIANGPKE